MNIPLCVTLGELVHRVQRVRNPLAALRIINLYRPAHWEIRVSFDQSQGTAIRFASLSMDDPTKAIITSGPALFDCDRIQFGIGGNVYEASWRNAAVDTPSTNLLSFEEIGGYDSGTPFVELWRSIDSHLPPSLLDVDAIAEYLTNETWFGSKGIHDGIYKTRLIVITRSIELSNAWHMRFKHSKAKAEGRPILELNRQIGSPPVAIARLTAHWGSRSKSFRWTEGAYTCNDPIAEQYIAPKMDALPNCELEVSFPQRQSAPDGELALETSLLACLDGVQAFCSEVASLTEYKDFVEEGTYFERSESARRIDRRKADLAASKFVFYQGRRVYKLPTSEMELVSLHQKLEGMNGLPFAGFESLEYTPKLGIDAIVNFKVEPIEPLRSFATVEFEFELGNFFDHAHPIEQTDLIICWKADRKPREALIQRDANRPWLCLMTYMGKVIRVATVSQYPDLEVN